MHGTAALAADTHPADILIGFLGCTALLLGIVHLVWPKRVERMWGWLDNPKMPTLLRPVSIETFPHSGRWHVAGRPGSLCSLVRVSSVGIALPPPPPLRHCERDSVGPRRTIGMPSSRLGYRSKSGPKGRGTRGRKNRPHRCRVTRGCVLRIDRGAPGRKRRVRLGRAGHHRLRSCDGPGARLGLSC